MRNRDDKKKPNLATIILMILLVIPQTAIPLIIGLVIYVIAKNKAKATDASSKTTYTQKKLTFDDLFCFHKDKGEHHVARGKEMDPWDRPDIDISKYQRKG